MDGPEAMSIVLAVPRFDSGSVRKPLSGGREQ
jgi:hypothetical protein